MSTEFISAQQKEIVAYFPSWRASDSIPYLVKNMVENKSDEKITVLNYAFIVPGPDSLGKIIPQFENSYLDYIQPYTSEMSVDGSADDSVNQPLRGHFNQLKKLKQKYPHLRIIVSIGGWGGSKYFSDAALNDQTRKIFVEACIDIFINGNLPIVDNAGGKNSAINIFDGFDVDWEFPYRGGLKGIHHNKNDINNFTKLLKLFREKLGEIKPGYLITSAVPAREADMKYFHFYEDQQYVDWYNLMTYDYHGYGDTITNHHTNLLTSPKDIISSSNSESFDKSIKLFNEVYGVNKSKIVPGAAFYGKAWSEVDSSNNGLYNYGKYNSAINFYDIKNLLLQGYKYFWDVSSMAPFLFSYEQKRFWTYDDSKSAALKSRYVDAYNLRGIMFWDISGDDSVATLSNSIYTGNMPDTKVKVQSENNSIYIKIINPKNSDWINEKSNLIIQTESSPKNILKVEFFGDGKSLGYCTTSPFNWVWFNISEGEHEIKVSALDSKGNKTFSKPVKFIVRKP